MGLRENPVLNFPNVLTCRAIPSYKSLSSKINLHCDMQDSVYEKIHLLNLHFLVLHKFFLFNILLILTCFVSGLQIIFLIF